MWELIVAGAAAYKVPALVEAAVRSTGEKLFGPMLDSLAQPIKDRTQQRSKMSQALTDLAARELGERPDIYRPAIDHLLHQEGARIDRKVSTFGKALAKLPNGPQKDGSEAEHPADDWLNRWSRYVEDASSDDLQDAFASILAGEITKKGSFSIATLRMVAELSPQTAADFQSLWADVIGDYVVKYERYSRGRDWAQLLRLREAGLASTADASIHRAPASRLWRFGGLPGLSIEVDPDVYSEVPIINLTQIGRELGSILPVPNTEANLRRLALECPDKRGWRSATLITDVGGSIVKHELLKFGT